MSQHRIRLHGPWTASLHLGGQHPRGKGAPFVSCVTLERAFHKPSGLQSNDQVILHWKTAFGISPTEVRLNQSAVSTHQSEEYWWLDVSATLLSYNQLEIDLPVSSLVDGWSVGRFEPGVKSFFLLEVFLEISSAETRP